MNAHDANTGWFCPKCQAHHSPDLAALAGRCEAQAGGIAFDEPHAAQMLRQAAEALRHADVVIDSVPEVLARARSSAMLRGTTQALKQAADLALTEATRIRAGERPIRGAADVLKAFAEALEKTAADLVAEAAGVEPIGNDNERGLQ